MSRKKRLENDMPSASELISSFVDGEEVDAGSLAKALAAPGGRETLLDFLRLRARLHEELDGVPGPEFYAFFEKRLSSREPTDVGRFRLIAAAVLALALGMVVGFGAGLSRAQESTAPPANRILHFEPGSDWHAIASEPPPPGREDR